MECCLDRCRGRFILMWRFMAPQDDMNKGFNKNILPAISGAVGANLCICPFLKNQGENYG